MRHSWGMRGSRGGVGALWAVFAAVAIVSGWVAVQMVGNAVTPASIPVLTASEVSQRLVTSAPTDDPSPLAEPSASKKSKKKPKATASQTQKPSSTSSPRPSPTPTATTTTSSGPAAVVRTLASRGGSVVAACRSGQVTLRSWSPAVGYRVDEVDAGPGREVEVRFVSNSAEVKMQVRCVSGVPSARTEYDSDSGDDN